MERRAWTILLSQTSSHQLGWAKMKDVKIADAAQDTAEHEWCSFCHRSIQNGNPNTTNNCLEELSQLLAFTCKNWEGKHWKGDCLHRAFMTSLLWDDCEPDWQNADHVAHMGLSLKGFYSWSPSKITQQVGIWDLFLPLCCSFLRYHWAGRKG